MSKLHSVETLSDAIVNAMPDLDARGRSIALATYQLLTRGKPVSALDVARSSGLPEDAVSAVLSDWNGVYRDPDGGIIGFWGLALRDMPHRLEIGEATIRTWCALDPLFIVPLLGESASVRTRDPVTGETLALEVRPSGVENLSPPEAVVSFLVPTGRWDGSVIQTFCHFVHLFGSAESAREWTREHPGTFFLSVAEAFDVGRRINEQVFGSPSHSKEGSGTHACCGA